MSSNGEGFQPSMPAHVLQAIVAYLLPCDVTFLAEAFLLSSNTLALRRTIIWNKAQKGQKSTWETPSTDSILYQKTLRRYSTKLYTHLKLVDDFKCTVCTKAKEVHSVDRIRSTYCLKCYARCSGYMITAHTAESKWKVPRNILYDETKVVPYSIDANKYLSTEKEPSEREFKTIRLTLGTKKMISYYFISDMAELLKYKKPSHRNVIRTFMPKCALQHPEINVALQRLRVAAEEHGFQFYRDSHQSRPKRHKTARSGIEKTAVPLADMPQPTFIPDLSRLTSTAGIDMGGPVDTPPPAYFDGF